MIDGYAEGLIDEGEFTLMNLRSLERIFSEWIEQRDLKAVAREIACAIL